MSSSASIERATLTIEANVTGGGTDTGVFEMAGDLQIRPSIRTGFLIGGRGSLVNSVLSGLGSSSDGSGEGEGDGTGEAGSLRRGYYLDLGSGAHVYEIRFTGWEGAEIGGDPLQWGNTGDAGDLTRGDATGEDPLTQIQVLMEYLRKGTIDSSNPARLAVGEHRSGGIYGEPLEVVLEGPQARADSSSGSTQTYTGTITCIEAAAFADLADAGSRLPW